jgi:hypothetical protein
MRQVEVDNVTLNAWDGEDKPVINVFSLLSLQY